MSEQSSGSARESTQPGTSHGTAPLVLGIVGIVIGLAPFAGWVGIILGILAVVFGSLGLPKPAAHSRSRTSLILGIIAIPLGFVSLFVWVLLFAFAIPGAPTGPGPQPTPISGTFTPAP